ncbi:MAG: DsrE family protein, partial [Pseudomonadota bacterium]
KPLFTKPLFIKPIGLRYFIIIFSLILSPIILQAEEHSSTIAQIIETPYSDEPKVVFEFFFDAPNKISGALYWIRSYMNTLMAEPYAVAPEFMDIKVIIHGTEIVSLAKKNYQKYKNSVERMRYYHQLGVEFRVCNIAADDYGYNARDFHPFVKIVPSAMVEIAHWQSKGYPLIRPIVYEKKLSIEEIR